MTLIEFFKQPVDSINFYAVSKPKFQKDIRAYTFLNDSVLDLSAFDTEDKLLFFYNVIKDKLVSVLEDTAIKEYDNKNNFEGFVYLDEHQELVYQDMLNPTHASLALIEAEAVSYSYLLVQVITKEDEALIWLKLKSPLKVINNTFLNESSLFDLTIKADGLTINNYPSINIDLNSIAFLYYREDFYIFDKELYQKYLNLDNYYVHQANMLVDEQALLVSDGELITKANAKMVYENFNGIATLCDQLEKGIISNEKLRQIINELELDINFSEDNRFILKRPKELLNLLLLSSGCVGINPLDQSIIIVKKPQFLVQD